MNSWNCLLSPRGDLPDLYKVVHKSLPFFSRKNLPFLGTKILLSLSKTNSFLSRTDSSLLRINLPRRNGFGN